MVRLDRQRRQRLPAVQHAPQSSQPEDLATARRRAARRATPSRPNPISGATACYTAQQFAAASYGPDGGGAGRQRSTRMGDYHLRFTTHAGQQQHHARRLSRTTTSTGKTAAWPAVSTPTGSCLGTPTFANFYNTKGFLASDEIVPGRNDFSFGYTSWHQLQTGNPTIQRGIVPQQSRPGTSASGATSRATTTRSAISSRSSSTPG